MQLLVLGQLLGLIWPCWVCCKAPFKLCLLHLWSRKSNARFRSDHFEFTHNQHWVHVATIVFRTHNIWVPFDFSCMSHVHHWGGWRDRFVFSHKKCSALSWLLFAFLRVTFKFTCPILIFAEATFKFSLAAFDFRAQATFGFVLVTFGSRAGSIRFRLGFSSSCTNSIQIRFGQFGLARNHHSGLA